MEVILGVVDRQQFMMDLLAGESESGWRGREASATVILVMRVVACPEFDSDWLLADGDVVIDSVPKLRWEYGERRLGWF